MENYGYDVSKIRGYSSVSCTELRKRGLMERQEQECKAHDEWDPYPERQMEALKRLVTYLAVKYGIPPDRNHIIGHDEVYALKSDPGPAFDWDSFIRDVGVMVKSEINP